MKVVLIMVFIFASFSVLAQVKPKTDSIATLSDSIPLVDSTSVPDSAYDWETGLSKPYLAYMPLKPPAGGYDLTPKAHVSERNSHLPFGYECSSRIRFNCLDSLRFAVCQCDYTGINRLGFVGIHHSPIYLFHQTYPKMNYQVTFYMKPPEIVINIEVKFLTILYPPLVQHLASMRKAFEQKFGNRFQETHNCKV